MFGEGEDNLTESLEPEINDIFEGSQYVGVEIRFDCLFERGKFYDCLFYQNKKYHDDTNDDML